MAVGLAAIVVWQVPEVVPVLVLLMAPDHQADCATQPTECLSGWAWLQEQPIHPPFFSKMAAGHQHQSELLCSGAAARFGPTHDTREAACIM